jgi:hypothetical protein
LAFSFWLPRCDRPTYTKKAPRCEVPFLI